MKDIVLLTGGTGHLGTEIAAQLLAAGAETEIYVLVRAEDEEAAYHRLRAVWYPVQPLYAQIGRRVFPVCGDLTRADLGLDCKAAQKLRDRVTLVIHAAAEIGFQKDAAALQAINVDGTRHVLEFAGQITDLRRFVHISTAYVAGQKRGVVTEDEPAGTAFSSLYEKSKAEAERLVLGSGLPCSVCRPGMIVGHSKTGRVANFNTIYYVLKQLLLGKMPVLPVDPGLRLNLIPVDEAAREVVRICAAEAGAAEGRVFHLTCPTWLQPTAKELADHTRTWAARELGVRLPKPVFAPLPALQKAGLTYNRKESGRQKSGITNLLTLLPYFYSGQDFDRMNADEVAGPYTLRWQNYIDPLLAYACRKNFMRQTGDTVFEQAMVRRASKRYPVRYYDVTAEGIRKVTGPEVNAQIGRIRNALYAWGVRKGDRVALTGINTTAYLALEQAIGLIGAVSVPIYYTTPAAEISLLLDRSGAGWFFVGNRRIMEHIGEVETTARIVSFSAGETWMAENGTVGEAGASAGSAAAAGVLRWDAFLGKGWKTAPAQHPDPEDLATIRYTSGTTGEPKGVMFNYAQLAWMGEVLTNLLPWEDRNRSMRYLSFLPLSHVVEGILASYAPYYVLAKVDYYYLNDFGSLTEALPKVRPNVFFSVPRFYEKVWQQLEANRFGQAWLGMADGPARQAAGAALRQIILRKAGLDNCKQLIVGSAPVSEELLKSYRKLGIEIHNAYGQTEAPLITINRLGDNVIPTIGTPLPETEVTAEPDGELIVRGPQVALGYYGLETDTIRDEYRDGARIGVLRTGDLGTIHENGHITLRGRKKEMIVTAYGKNISIPKLEERLKGLPGVTEAVLIGENRPYCTALLWMEGAAGSAGAPAGAAGAAGSAAGSNSASDGHSKALDAQIEAMNSDLSHPEQIRKYRIIDRPLSIAAGELTPNLKVKRANVEAHFRDEIEEMYR